MEHSSILMMNLGAVELMTKGSYSSAVAVLRSALQELLLDCASDDNTKYDADTVMIRCEVRDLCSNPVNLDDNSVALYAKAFQILGTHERIVFMSEPRRNQAAVIVLYNMALSIQMMAIQCATKQCANLRKALELYQCALELNEQTTVPRISNLLQMAILNNMGNIHSHFSTFESMYECFEGVRICLLDEAVANEHDDVVHFHLNVALFYSRSNHGAPAA